LAIASPSTSIQNEDISSTVLTVPCPIDRIQIPLDNLTSTILSISNLVDELRIFCPYRNYHISDDDIKSSDIQDHPNNEEKKHSSDLLENDTEVIIKGCPWIGQRSKLSWHLTKECSNCPIACGFDICPVVALRGDIENHRLVCDFKPVNNMNHGPDGLIETKSVIDNNNNQNNYNHNSNGKLVATSNDSELIPSEDIQQDNLSHHFPDLQNSISTMRLQCPHSVYGCRFIGSTSFALESHLCICPFHALRDYLYKHDDCHQHILNENRTLRSDIMHIQSILPVTIAEGERLNIELNEISSGLATMEFRQNTALANEIFLLREELANLKSEMKSLQRDFKSKNDFQISNSGGTHNSIPSLKIGNSTNHVGPAADDKRSYGVSKKEKKEAFKNEQGRKCWVYLFMYFFSHKLF